MHRGALIALFAATSLTDHSQTHALPQSEPFDQLVSTSEQCRLHIDAKRFEDVQIARIQG
jgi:hypothetical protein